MRILIVSSVDPDVVIQLSTEHEVTVCRSPSASELRELVRGQEVLIFRSGVRVSREILRASSRLRLLVRAGSGFDNVDVEEARRRGIHLERIPGPGARAVAELTFALMLGLARNVLPLDRGLRQGQWGKDRFQNSLLGGKTLGIVGAGNIGGRVGQLGVAWGMRALGCVESASPEVATRLRELGMHLAGFEEVVAEADFLSIHVPLTEATRGELHV